MACSSKTVNGLLDVFCVILAWVPVVLVKKLGHPVQRGFFCNDQAIQYPLQPATIPSSVIYSLSFGLPILLIAVVELYRAISTKKYAFRWTPKKEVSLPVHCLARIFTAIRHFLIGGAAAALLVLVGKFTVGRLRPHFMAACSPTPGKGDCPTHLWATFITDYQCEEGNTDAVDDARQSFPSGGSATIFYGMIFTALYLELRSAHLPGLARLRYLFQGGLVALAAFIALKRVTDHRHHSGDVLAGAVLGILLAGVSIYQLSKSLGSEKSTTEDADKPAELIAV